ncbi:F-box DNA helicase 1 [Aplochiton taeniatus]
MALASKGRGKRKHLGAEECGQLGRSPEGTQALRHPQSVTRTNSDPNQWLYPRTPTKRNKIGSPDKQQKSIATFFPVTGVLSSSPQKTAQPGSSTQSEGLHGTLTSKEEPTEDDVVTTPIKEEPEEEIDYLEGMTADMFGDDEEFEQEMGASTSGQKRICLSQEEEEEEVEVEALPDSHYGLLGASRGLVEPQGHIDDLPEEVLRLVMSLLPADDLYRHASLVCHRWRNIVKDKNFVPCKKNYYRYLKSEREIVHEMKSILEDSGMLDFRMAEDTVLHLVFMMAHHQPTERVDLERVLQSVKTHRLFPQAKASFELVVSDIRKHVHHGVKEGHNPWAIMAVILLLSDSVGDMLALVSRLRTCMPSHSSITEYLSEMATFLLAMKRHNLQISNRLHYNIYYVLHLMENAPSTSSTSQSRSGQPQVTHEQQQILNHDVQRDHVVKIMAFAGTGKTTTLVSYAQKRPHLRFLYVAFNKSVANQAQRSFPGNVHCKTIHSMAFGSVGKIYLKKLAFNIKPFSVACVLPKGRGGFINAKVVSTTLNTYMASSDNHINISHVPHTFKNNRGQQQTMQDCKKEVRKHPPKKHVTLQGYVQDAQNIWSKMVDTKATSEGYKMTHDGYLKLWQLQQPCLDEYDVILVDEAQDCTPAIVNILMSQPCGKILVGDPHQQIYTFRGAVNALHLVQHTHLYYLTQSFRFGAEIAYVAATILEVCKKAKKILVGGRQEGSVRGETLTTEGTARSGLTLGGGRTAILSRCNATVFDEAVNLTDTNPRCRLHIVGGVENFGLSKILDIWRLMQPEEQHKREIKDGFIRNFNKGTLGGYAGLKNYASNTEDHELVGKLTVVEKYNCRIPQLVDRILSCSENNFQNADVVLGTVHKSKGLEFDTVAVSDDFAKVPCARHNLEKVSSFSWGDIPKDKWNLLYVAVTRAKTTLIITKNISYILTLAGEYFLRSEMTSSLTKEGQLPQCSIRECHNSILPDSAFVMCREPVRYMDNVDPGGPLCERCVCQRIGPAAYLMAPKEKLFSMPATEESLDLPINYAMLLALF